MKKLLLLLIVIMLCIISACSVENLSTVSDSPLYFGKQNISFNDFKTYSVWDEGENFIVYQYVQTEPFNNFYWYNVFDNDKNVILNGGTEWKAPQITEENHIVTVVINNGTLADKSIYYNTKNNMISKEYNNVLAQKDELICFYENKKLVITDAFDNDYYKEIQRNFKDIPIPVEKIDFADDNAITISYYSSDNSIITETINL